MRSWRHEDAPGIVADIDVDFFAWQLLDRLSPKHRDVELELVHQLCDQIINWHGEDSRRIKGVEFTLQCPADMFNHIGDICTVTEQVAFASSHRSHLVVSHSDSAGAPCLYRD